MHLKSLTVTCVLAWLGVGCGGEVPEPSLSDDVGSTKQPIIWLCEATDRWTRTWYMDFSQTTRVGTEYCCNGLLTRTGTRMGYYTQASTLTCGPQDPD